MMGHQNVANQNVGYLRMLSDKTQFYKKLIQASFKEPLEKLAQNNRTWEAEEFIQKMVLRIKNFLDRVLIQKENTPSFTKIDFELNWEL